jgi:dTDP-4-amino-4,6-dideoxygalactose transaminase
MDKVVEKIPILDLSHEVEELWDEINAAIQRVLRSTQFILGPDVQLFEQEVAAYLGVKHAVGLNSGTDALIIGLRALGIGPGDEVITTPFSFFATAESISSVGATPVFADIEERSFNIDPEEIRKAITPRTKAIMPVHLYGNPAAMGQIMQIAAEHNLKVIEDCAQSFGARYEGNYTGIIGQVGAYSFFPSKNLGAYGDGGLLATNDDQVAELARMLRAHGSKKKYHNEMVGYNSRLDTLQAAILQVKLPHVDRWNQMRRKVAYTYSALLKDLPGVIVPEISDGHVFHQYTIRLTHANRDGIQHKLKEAGIETMVYYPVPQDQLPVYKDPNSACPISKHFASQVLSLPIWPNLSLEKQTRVVEVLLEAMPAEAIGSS